MKSLSSREASISAEMEHIRKAEQRKVQDLYQRYEAWIRDTLETDDNPSIHVAMIFPAA